MALKFEKLVAGQTVYEITKRKMGRTTISTVSVYPIKILEIDHENKTAKVSWNGNAAKDVKKKYFDRSNIRKTRPELIQSFTGSQRLPSRRELKEIKEKKNVSG